MGAGVPDVVVGQSDRTVGQVVVILSLRLVHNSGAGQRDGYQLDKVKELCDLLYDNYHAKAEEILIDAVDGTALPPELTYEVDLGEGERYLPKHRDL